MAKTGPLSRNLSIVLVLIAILAVSVVAFFGYQYYQEQQRLEMLHRDAVKTAYQEKLTAANNSFAAIQGLPPLQNKNRTVDYRKWIDGYQVLLGNYTSVVNDTEVAGDAYAQAFGKGSPEEAWVIENNTRLNGSLDRLNDQYAMYETDYRTVVAARDRAKQAFENAYNNSTAMYALASDSLFAENYSAYPGLKAYLNACSKNITLYKQSIQAAKNASEQYQAYLRTDSQEYDDVYTKADELSRKTPALEKRYTSLQAKIPTLEVTVGATDYNFSGDLGWYEYVTFLVTNKNYPTPVSNVTVHFTSYDNSTGLQKDTTDVPVVIHTQMSKYHGAILKIDRGHTYSLKWTISYDY